MAHYTKEDWARLRTKAKMARTDAERWRVVAEAMCECPDTIDGHRLLGTTWRALDSAYFGLCHIVDMLFTYDDHGMRLHRRTYSYLDRELSAFAYPPSEVHTLDDLLANREGRTLAALWMAMEAEEEAREDTDYGF